MAAMIDPPPDPPPDPAPDTPPDSPPDLPASLPLRCVSIDVEEYFHIEAAHGHVSRDRWDNFPSRVERNVELLLNLFDRFDRKVTFFVLGHVAQRHAAMVRRMAGAGHEIASHGMNHDRLHHLDRDLFRNDLMTSKRVLEDQVGEPVVGYRAPTFSVTTQTAWAIDVLAECGFEYDASIFPVRHPWYGVPTAPLTPFHVRGEDGAVMLEIPPLVWRIGSMNLPVAGGGYFRLLPTVLMRRGLAQAARLDRPAVLYFHPWEFDPQMPRLPLPWTGRIRTYTGINRTAARLERVVALAGRWTTLAMALGEMRRHAKQHPVFDLTAHA